MYFSLVRVSLNTRAPLSTDDSTQGQVPGARWIYGNLEWVCVDATPNSAVWVPSGAGSTIEMDNITGLVSALSNKADLDAGKIPASQLPSYVDDVIEGETIESFPAVGESGKIYIDKDTNKTYRWGGSGYAEISASLALGETSSTAHRGDHGKAAYDHSIATGNPHNLTLAALSGSPIGHTHDMSSIPTGNLLADRIASPTYTTTITPNIYRSLFDVLRADRIAFLPADQIIIEQSTDAGATWVSAAISDSNKRRLFTGQRPNINIPLKGGIQSTDCMLRITITGMKYNVPGGTAEVDKYGFWNSAYVASTERYFGPTEGWIWLTSVSDRIDLKVEKATGASPNAWVLDRQATMAGWDAGNYMSLNGSTFGGNVDQTGNYWNWRFTFRTCSARGTFVDADLSPTYNTIAQSIYHIKLGGENIWTYTNGYMYNDHLYGWDEYKNALFPANIQGVQFVSTVADGTPPLAVTSETVVPGLNADKVDGKHYLDILKAVYPIGSIYMSVNAANPGSFFGFGTWEAWGTGRVPVGVDTSQTEFNTVEETGGSKTHALTVAELPSHTHALAYSGQAWAIGTTKLQLGGQSTSNGYTGTPTGATGSGVAHSNLQPYITCYMWKRTA